MKKLSFIIPLLTMGLQLNAANPVAETSDDVIFHAWCWSFNTIRENIPEIAKAGYTIVQTVPAQHCVTQAKGDKGGGPDLWGHGRWYYFYQPIDWQIGNYVVGNADDLTALCQEAEKYGIRIIVDVLPNHTAIDDTRVEDALDAAVGGHENLYHSTGFDEIRDYNDRLQCTTGQMGGLPDVNTENPDFQAYYMTYVNNLIQCGVRGFRYDTAKHIGLPSDPKDAKSPKNNFWAVATGRESANGVRLCMPEEELFIYGEVLQDRNVKETEYAEYMGMTASSLGNELRHDLEKGSWAERDVVDFHHPVTPAKLVTWVESHDTYCNGHESANLSDAQIRVGWAFLTARQLGTPLFYNRPAGSDGPAGNFWGENVIGAAGNDNYRHPVVVAANRFRAQMKGQPETVSFGENGAVAVVSRGKKGAAVINISNASQTVNVATTLPNGTYKDAVSGTIFKVKKGMLMGEIASLNAVFLIKK